MRLQELAAVFGEAVELPGIPLPALVVVQSDLRDDAGVDQLLDVLVDGRIADAGLRSYIEGSCSGCWGMLLTSANRVSEVLVGLVVCRLSDLVVLLGNVLGFLKDKPYEGVS